MSVIRDAFSSTKPLFTRDDERYSEEPESRVVYSDLNERASVEPLPLYVRENRTRHSTMKTVDSGDLIHVLPRRTHPPCDSLAKDFSDDNVPLHQEFLVVSKLAEGVPGGSHPRSTIEFAVMRFEDGCMVEVKDYPVIAIEFTLREFYKDCSREFTGNPLERATVMNEWMNPPTIMNWESSI
tara:strand:- start:2391 stop:2936 length:546 start_codon:yes stop_codon:yes gene_type:complete